MGPLRDDAVGSEAVAHGREEFAREKCRLARHPRIRWLGDDDVVLTRRQQQVRAAVSHNEVRTGIIQPVQVDVGKVPGCLDDLRRDFHDIRARDGMDERGTQRDAAAQSDDANLLRVWMQQQRQVSECFLREHVAEARRVDFAVDHQRPGPRQTLHRHG